MKTIKFVGTWLNKHALQILLALFLLGIPAAFLPAGMEFLNLQVQKAKLKAQAQVYRTPKASYDTLIETVKDFKEVFPSATSGSLDLKEFISAQHWYDARVIMTKRFVGDIYSNAGSPNEFAFDRRPDNLERMLAELKAVNDQYANSIRQHYSERELRTAQEDYDSHYSYLEPQIELDYSTFYADLVLGYLALCCWSLPYLLVKAAKNGFKLRYEFRRLPAVMAMFPLMLPAYPWGTPRQQLQKTLRFAAGLLSLILSAFTITITASAQTASASKGKQDCYALIDDRTAVNPESTLLKLQGGQTDKETAPACTPEKTATASASKPTTSPRFVVSSTTEFWSEYVGMNLAVFNDQPVLQQTFRLTHRATGFYVQPFVSMALTNRNHRGQNFGDEADLRLGWNHTFSHGLNLDVAGNYVNVSQLYRLPNGDVIQVRADLSKTLKLSDRQSITPFLTVSNFHPLKGAAPKRGTLVLGGTNYNFNSNQFTLGATMKLVADGGPFAFDKALLLQTELDPGFRVRGNLTWYPVMLQFNTPLTTVRDKRGPELAIGSRLKF